MTYDQHQLHKDLKRIVTVYGKRQPYGFYTIGVYKDTQVKIVDTYTDPRGPLVIRDGVVINSTDLVPSEGLGLHILKLAIRAEAHILAQCKDDGYYEVVKNRTSYHTGSYSTYESLSNVIRWEEDRQWQRDYKNATDMHGYIPYA